MDAERARSGPSPRVQGGLLVAVKIHQHLAVIEVEEQAAVRGETRWEVEAGVAVAEALSQLFGGSRHDGQALLFRHAIGH